MKNLQIRQIIYLFTLAILLNLALAANTQAATVRVTKISDTDDGVCDDDCSLPGIDRRSKHSRPTLWESNKLSKMLPTFGEPF